MRPLTPTAIEDTKQSVPPIQENIKHYSKGLIISNIIVKIYKYVEVNICASWFHFLVKIVFVFRNNKNYRYFLQSQDSWSDISQTLGILSRRQINVGFESIRDTQFIFISIFEEKMYLCFKHYKQINYKMKTQGKIQILKNT